MSNIAFVNAFFDKWRRSYDTMRTSFQEDFSDSCEWDQRPFALTVGPDEAVRFMDRCRRFGGIETIDVEVARISEAGDSVLCARIDHLYRRNGSLIASVPVAGAMDVRGGKIVYWREYVDSVGVVRQAAASGIRESLSWLRTGSAK